MLSDLSNHKPFVSFLFFNSSDFLLVSYKVGMGLLILSISFLLEFYYILLANLNISEMKSNLALTAFMNLHPDFTNLLLFKPFLQALIVYLD